MKIKLLKDIEDKYYGIKYTKDSIVPVLTNYMYDKNSDNKVIHVFGHGDYLYANKGEYELFKPSKS